MDNATIEYLKNTYGNNIGMLAAIHKMEDVTLKALDNHEASLQQAGNGWNIGMYTAHYKMEDLTIKALDKNKMI